VRVIVDPAAGGRNANIVQQPDGALAGLALGQAQMGADGLDQLIGDRVKRIERGERILKHHADAAPRMARMSSAEDCRCAHPSG
jgi:hypothetical protein